jgi:hypothetical protein
VGFFVLVYTIVSEFAQQMLYRLDQHYHSLPIAQARLDYQKQYSKIP